MPGLRRMAALADPNNGNGDEKLHALQEAARAHDVELSIHRVVRGDEIAAAIDMAWASGAKAVNVLASPMLYVHRQFIMERVATLRLPAMYQWPDMADEGGFVAYGPRLTLIPELTARLAVSSSMVLKSQTFRWSSRPNLSWSST